MIVFEKQKRNTPFHIRKGAETITPYRQIELKRNSILMRIKSKLFGKKVNTIDINDRGKL